MVVPGQDMQGVFDMGGVSSGVDPDGIRRSPNYAVVDSLGQFVVGESDSPNYRVQHGYWSGVPDVTECGTLAEMMRLPDDSLVRLTAAMPVTVGTDKFLRRFYVECTDRSSGLLVRRANGPEVAANDVVTICGKLATIAGERCLDLATVESKSAGTAPKPLAMPGRSIGGVGVLDGYGLYNIGLLIKTTGKVTFRSPDGSND